MHRYPNVPPRGVFNRKVKTPERIRDSSPHHNENAFYEMFPKNGIIPESRKPLVYKEMDTERQERQLRTRVRQLIAQDKSYGEMQKTWQEHEVNTGKLKPTRKTKMVKVLEKKDPLYYTTKGIMPGNTPEAKFFEVDELTGLPYGLGYDNELEERKEVQGQAAAEGQYLSIVRELGFKSIEDALMRVESKNVRNRTASLHSRLYTKHNPNAETYDKIEFKENPRSQQKLPNGLEEFFSDDYSDEEQTKGKSAQDIENDAWLRRKKDEAVALGVGRVLREQIQEHFEEKEMKIDEGCEDPDLTIDYENYMADDNTKQFYAEYVKNNILIPVRNKMQEMSNLKQEATRTTDRVFDTKGKLDTANWKEKTELFKHSTPTFKEVMEESDLMIASGPSPLKLLLARDKYEGNDHFQPRYLNKDFREDDFGWAYEHLKNVETLYPGIVYGDISPRMDPASLTFVENAKRKAHQAVFKPSQESKDAITIFGLINKDPYYNHFLNNHLRFWVERTGKDPLSLTARAEPGKNKPFALIPWESVLINSHSNKGTLQKRKRLADEQGRVHGYGSRKCAHAFAYLKPGIGKITINGLNFLDYFSQTVYRSRIIRPFNITDTACEFDLTLLVDGGGSSAQSQACCLAVARALTVYGSIFQIPLAAKRELKANPRQVERKKTSRHKARKSYTFVKR